MTRPSFCGLVVNAGSVRAIGPLREALSALPALDRSVFAGERITPGAVSIARSDLHLGGPTSYWKEPA
ncbi:MAG TPA: hypothetical protein VFT28_07070 [Gemmatimonadales bacterium]|nr:hypothetical protein [Gemmatimonadales bacterium]